MKKSVFLSGVVASLVLVGSLLVHGVQANEGTVLLKGPGGGACYIASVFQDGAYRLLATCRDLKVALTPEKTFYVLWLGTAEGDERRLGPVVNGKFSGSVDQKFTSLKLTVETDGYPMKPSTDLVMTGELKPIDFGGVASEIVVATPTPTAVKADVEETAVKETVAKTKSNNTALGGMLATVFKIILFAFGILLVVVGVFSFLSRRRSL